MVIPKSGEISIIRSGLAPFFAPWTSRRMWVILGILILLAAALGVYAFYAKPTPVDSSGAHVDASGAHVDSSGCPPAADSSGALAHVEYPFILDPIQSVDDYEYSLIFKNEGDRAITKETRDLLMSAYPKDWTTQPPSSDVFQRGLASYKESFADKGQDNSKNPFTQIDGSNMIPPDSMEAEQKEREILATYVPKKPGELTTYDAEDANDLIKKIYSAKGLVADVKDSGNGVFTIVGTRPVNSPVVYEDSYATASSQAVGSNGEAPVSVTQSQDINATVEIIPTDPFFTPGVKARGDKWDYTSWTPGLERAFAPTEPRTNWY